MEVKSKITGKVYLSEKAVYLTNPIQCQRYFKFLGDEHFLDILYESNRGEECLVFVWEKNAATKEAKLKWDQHAL